MSNANDSDSYDFTLADVADFLDSEGSDGAGDLHGLTGEKIRRRAIQIRSDEHPGCVVFEMERHKSAFGSENIKGAGMTSYVTSRERYAFDPKEKCISALGTVSPRKLEVDTDTRASVIANDMSFEFSVDDAGRTTCRETCTCGSWVVQGPEDFDRVSRDVFDEDSFLMDVEDLEADLDEEEKQEYAAEMAGAFAELMLEKLREAWKDYQDELTDEENE
ncbi:MAG: hypothetical protein GC168_05200 [Candidatus Hydrogenedens sp.]|nr:hypothetical protein [Candidatus Hydrogenedens sp.]